MTHELRWRNYSLGHGLEMEKTWKSHLAKRSRNVLYILGLGFDERMCDGFGTILTAGGTGKRDVVLLTFDEGPESASQTHADARDQNKRRLDALGAGTSVIDERQINLVSSNNRRVGGRSIASAFEPGDFREYSDVVVDISALPRGLYFPLLAKLLTIFDTGGREFEGKNLHVMVAHSPVLDSATNDEGIEETATYLFGFSAAEFERESTREQPRIWLPVLGRNQRVQLERIYALVAPDEICPVLPSPAANPRESDDLLLEYRDVLFDQFRVEARNLIYASESNPFEVYRQIVRAVGQYQLALAPVGGCKAVVSAMSSKLSSVGALLAAYELRSTGDGDHIDVGVAHVEAQGYQLHRPDNVLPSIVYSLWLCGECYD